MTITGVDHLRAAFNANAYSGRVEGGYRFVGPWSGGVGIAPYAAAQVTTIALPSYSEQVVSGAGSFALNYASRSPTDTRSELGVRTDKSFAVTNGVLSLRGRLAWAQARDSALTSAAVEMHWMAGWSAAATFEGEFSDTTRSYAGKAVVRYAW